MHVYNPPVCPCGKEVQPTPGTKNDRWIYTKKYCDSECRRKYMVNGNQRDESKWKIYVCLNCGESFERRINTRNAKKYCSNACAQRHTKKRHHIILRDDDVVLDSSWEAAFWGIAKLAKLDIERFDRQHAVEWKEGQFYAPDFWLPIPQVAIEVKGQPEEDDLIKWEVFRNTGKALVVMDDYRMEYLSAHDIHSVIRIVKMRDNPSWSPIAAVVKS